MARLNLNLKDNLLASDTEATGINPWGSFKRWGFYPARPFAFSFCDSEGNTDYIRWEVKPKTRQVILEPRTFQILEDIYSNPSLTHVGHNFEFDVRMLDFIGIQVTGHIEDTLKMAHIMTGGGELTYALKPLSVKYLGMSINDEKELQEATKHMRLKGRKLGWCIASKEHFGKEPIKADYWMAPPDLCKTYAIQDSVRTMLFYQLWIKELQEDLGMYSVYKKEMKLACVVRKMENRGVRVFPEDLARLRKIYEEYIDQQLKTAEGNGGKGLNFRSHKQMTQKFYVEKKCKPKISEKSGNWTLDGDKLAELAQTDKLARCILEFRNANHMITAFLNPYERFRVQESPSTWVIHPGYKQCGPVTGQFAGSDPNLMQVASESTGRRRSEITMRPREAFGPREGYIWYLPDYSQIEVWAFAFMAKDPSMMEILLSGRDFHGEISKRVWGNNKDYEEKKSYYRKRAKLLMFCKLYGGGAKKVAFLLKDASEISGQSSIKDEIEEATKFIAEYDTQLPGVQLFMKRMMNQSMREGKIINPFGRVYYIDANFAYKSVNYIIQGTCADIMKQAMLNVDKLFTEKWKGCHLLLTLHDELICEVPLKLHSKHLMRDIVIAMQGNFHEILNIPKPLPVSVKIADKRWSQTRDINLC